MTDHLDRRTGERMLRGEDTGPRPLAALLAAASARPVRDDRFGEEVAVAAFHAARSDRRAEPSLSRRLLRPRALAIKTALAGFMLMLAGGVALAASPHLVPSPHHARARVTRMPVRSRSTTMGSAIARPSHTHLSRSPGRSGERAAKPHHHQTGNRSKGRNDGHGTGNDAQTEPSPPTPTPNGGPKSSPAENRPPAAPASPSSGCDASCDSGG